MEINRQKSNRPAVDISSLKPGDVFNKVNVPGTWLYIRCTHTSPWIECMNLSNNTTLSMKDCEVQLYPNATLSLHLSLF